MTTKISLCPKCVTLICGCVHARKLAEAKLELLEELERRCQTSRSLHCAFNELRAELLEEREKAGAG